MNTTTITLANREALQVGDVAHYDDGSWRILATADSVAWQRDGTGSATYYTREVPSAPPITAETLALLLDGNSDMGQWDAADVCDAVYELARDAMRDCPSCGLAQSRLRDNCIGGPEEFGSES